MKKPGKKYDDMAEKDNEKKKEWHKEYNKLGYYTLGMDDVKKSGRKKRSSKTPMKSKKSKY